MEVRLRTGRRSVDVRLVPREGGYTATVDGAEHLVALLGAGPRATVGGDAAVEELALEVDGRARRALVVRRRDQILVAIDGRVYAFETGEATRQASRGAGSGAVVAPMPGKILAVLVAAGDTVAVGDPLVVLEAMKMENTLAAEVAGRVTTVRASVGALVTAGDLLVEITAEASAEPA
jgi:biotin carboxyl carrier protein